MSIPRQTKKTLKKHRSMAPSMRRLFFWGAVVIVLSFGLLSTFSHNGILDLVKLQALHRNLQNENSRLLREQEELKSEVFQLQDPHYVAYLARERLGLMRSNEFFIILDHPQPHSTVDNE